MQSAAAANMIASKPADDAPSVSSSPSSPLQMGQGQEKPQSQLKQTATAATTTPNKKKIEPSLRYPFWFGGSASSMAACVTHPLDLGK
ncbi:hypothetical protein CH063_05008 [Colletotrichum higginsianum]|uniref:Uncharacterized protein n=1 Tax=Colletotrichum higginsianum (strain IMI 349063) TaxID=759273 RepID=H1UXG7_COLHI|nr:hypothetical protein CH063_05008 [Colletotrichum higginsianum]